MPQFSRREALKQIGAGGAGAVITGSVIRGQTSPIRIAGMPVEIAVASISSTTVRITAAAIVGTGGVPEDGALVRAAEVKPTARRRAANSFMPLNAGNLVVRYTADPPTIHVDAVKGTPIQKLVLNADKPGISFLLPKGPLLGLGEGGPPIAKARSIECEMGRAAINFGRTADAYPSSGSLARTAGACSSTTRSAPSTSPASRDC